MNAARNTVNKVNRSANKAVSSANKAMNRSHAAVARAVRNMNSSAGGGTVSMISWVILLLIALFTILLLVFLIQYLRTPCPAPGKKDFWTYVQGMDPQASPCAEPEPEVEYEEREEKDEREPYLIKDMIFTRAEAPYKCRAYGAELATKQQLIKYYNEGGHAPQLGWIQGRHSSGYADAYQVVAPCEYVKMRRQGLSPAPPGVNGGLYNDHVRLGAWCYGIKPPGSVEEPKGYECPYPEICQRNPSACKPLKKDSLAAFFPGREWSVWDGEQLEQPVKRR